jgi:hypothetical protein
MRHYARYAAVVAFLLLFGFLAYAKEDAKEERIKELQTESLRAEAALAESLFKKQQVPKTFYEVITQEARQKLSELQK